MVQLGFSSFPLLYFHTNPDSHALLADLYLMYFRVNFRNSAVDVKLVLCTWMRRTESRLVVVVLIGFELSRERSVEVAVGPVRKASGIHDHHSCTSQLLLASVLPSWLNMWSTSGEAVSLLPVHPWIYIYKVCSETSSSLVKVKSNGAMGMRAHEPVCMHVRGQVPQAIFTS